MNITFKYLALAISLLLPAMFSSAAEITMRFETVTSFKIGYGGEGAAIIGTEKYTGVSLAWEFTDTIEPFCAPLIMTVMEKPGRYYLHVTTYSGNSDVANCYLELKPQPE